MRKHTYTVGDLFTSTSSGATVEVIRVDNAHNVIDVRNIEWDDVETYPFEEFDSLLNDGYVKPTTNTREL